MFWLLVLRLAGPPQMDVMPGDVLFATRDACVAMAVQIGKKMAPKTKAQLGCKPMTVVHDKRFEESF